MRKIDFFIVNIWICFYLATFDGHLCFLPYSAIFYIYIFFLCFELIFSFISSDDIYNWSIIFIVCVTLFDKSVIIIIVCAQLATSLLQLLEL